MYFSPRQSLFWPLHHQLSLRWSHLRWCLCLSEPLLITHHEARLEIGFLYIYAARSLQGTQAASDSVLRLTSLSREKQRSPEQSWAKPSPCSACSLGTLVPPHTLTPPLRHVSLVLHQPPVLVTSQPCSQLALNTAQAFHRDKFKYF